MRYCASNRQEKQAVNINYNTRYESVDRSIGFPHGDFVEVLDVMTGNSLGSLRDKREAHASGVLHGAFHLWLVAKVDGVDGIYAQMRSPTKSVAPGCLDASAGGHYHPGESSLDGLRELDEELGVTLDPRELFFLGKRYSFFVNDSVNNAEIIDVFIAQVSLPLEAFKLRAQEVVGLYFIPLSDIVRMFRCGDSVSCSGIAVDPRDESVSSTIIANKDSFAPSIDQYAYKVAVLAARYLNGETDLVI